MKDSAFKKMLFNQCLDNLAARGRSAAETCGTQPTDTQQLKAEIAETVSELDIAYSAPDMDHMTIRKCIERFRQLSAV